MALVQKDSSERLFSSMERCGSTLSEVLSVLQDMRSMLGILVAVVPAHTFQDGSGASGRPNDTSSIEPKSHSSWAPTSQELRPSSASTFRAKASSAAVTPFARGACGEAVNAVTESRENVPADSEETGNDTVASRNATNTKFVNRNSVGDGAACTSFACAASPASRPARASVACGHRHGEYTTPRRGDSARDEETMTKTEDAGALDDLDDLELRKMKLHSGESGSEDGGDVLPVAIDDLRGLCPSNIQSSACSRVGACGSKMSRLDNRDSEEVSSASSLREDCWRRFSSGSEGLGLEEKLSAMETLDSLLTEQGSISNADFVACLRALGLQMAFKDLTRADLTEDTVTLLFPEEVLRSKTVTFPMFQAAMRRLEGQNLLPNLAAAGASASASSGAGAGTGHRQPKQQDLDMDPTLAVSASPSPRTSMVSFAMDRSRRRPSLFTTRSYDDFADSIKRLGGRVAKLETSFHCLASPECLLLAPSEGPSTGVVLCLHGLLPSQALLAEWSLTAERARWRDMGMSIAIPNLQMSAALVQQDLESILEATLQLLDARRCLIVGKGWGAQKAAELADSERLADRIDGLVLIPSGYTAPHLHDSIDVPVMLAWSQDDRIPDETLDGEEGTACWIRTLDQCGTPILFHQIRSSELDLRQLLEDASLASRLQLFSAASLLIAELQEADDERSPYQLARLHRNLPSFLQSQTTEGMQDPLRLLQTIAQWIQAGLPTATE